MSKINPSLSSSLLSDSSQKVVDVDTQKTPTKESTNKNKNKNNHDFQHLEQFGRTTQFACGTFNKT
jgi:hypothetical protein